MKSKDNQTPRTKEHSMNWDLKSYFPEFKGPKMVSFKKKIIREISKLLDRASKISAIGRGNAEQWEAVLLAFEDLTARYSHISSYVGCLASCDALNPEYHREEADMALIGARFSNVEILLLQAFRDTDEKTFKAFTRRPRLCGIAYYLNRMKEASRHMMSKDMECLAVELGVDGISAWGRLYDSISGRLEFDMVFPDGKTQKLPMSQRRSLLDHPDRSVRQAAFEGGNKAWASVEHVCAAALNALSGTRMTLNRKRGIKHFLDVALFQSAISRKTLDAMFKAVHESIEIPRKCLRLKARLMGRKSLAWYDIGAPAIAPDTSDIPWNKACEIVTRAFGETYPELGRFMQDALDRKWVEWEPRKGKRPGAFCTGSLLTKESRIFMSYTGNMGEVRTLAHETGHAFHSHVMKKLRPYAHFYPMTLAETASTMGEMILSDSLLADGAISRDVKQYLLDLDLGNAAIYLLDICTRFEFEKTYHEQRAGGELSPEELRGLMVQTQQEIFGDVLEKGGEDPLFWASKLHYYISEVTFYNFPYTFGYLLSRGLYAMMKEEGAAFLPRYEKFLMLSGSATCEDVVMETLGQDIRKPKFWARAIKSLEEPIGFWRN